MGNSEMNTNNQITPLIRGGLFYKLTVPLRSNNKNKNLLIIASIIVAITWFPICILSFTGNTVAHDTSQTISFIEDFLFHVRYLIVVPFLVLIEPLIESSFTEYIETTKPLIPVKKQSDFGHLIKQLNSLIQTNIPDVIAISIIYLIAFMNWDKLWVFSSSRNFLADLGTQTLTPAGWYYIIICSPIFQLLVFRWVWRWFIWVYSIVKVAKFKLQTDAMHADQMAGLEYLNLFPLSLSFLLTAPSAIFSAYIGIEIVYNGASLTDFIIPIAVYVIGLPMVLYAPLSLFLPSLLQSRAFGIRKFGGLIRKHDQEFTNSWISNTTPKEGPILGSTDPSSLADINGSYQSVQTMQLVPINFKMISASFIMNLLPYTPLIFTYYSVTDLFNLLLKSVGS